MQRCRTYEQLVNTVETHEDAIQQYPVAVQTTILQSTYEIDNHAQELNPLDETIQIKIYGDGNCLPRCGSILAMGHENSHIEIRVRIMIKQGRNAKQYLDNEHIKLSKTSNENFVGICTILAVCTRWCHDLTSYPKAVWGWSNVNHSIWKLQGNLAVTCSSVCSEVSNSVHVSCLRRSNSSQTPSSNYTPSLHTCYWNDFLHTMVTYPRQKCSSCSLASKSLCGVLWFLKYSWIEQATTKCHARHVSYILSLWLVCNCIPVSIIHLFHILYRKEGEFYAVRWGSPSKFYVSQVRRPPLSSTSIDDDKYVHCIENCLISFIDWCHWRWVCSPELHGSVWPWNGWYTALLLANQAWWFLGKTDIFFWQCHKVTP